jgi:hypothetical protein
MKMEEFVNADSPILEMIVVLVKQVTQKIH